MVRFEKSFFKREPIRCSNRLASQKGMSLFKFGPKWNRFNLRSRVCAANFAVCGPISKFFFLKKRAHHILYRCMHIIFFTTMKKRKKCSNNPLFSQHTLIEHPMGSRLKKKLLKSDRKQSSYDAFNSWVWAQAWMDILVRKKQKYSDFAQTSDLDVSWHALQRALVHFSKFTLLRVLYLATEALN